MTRIAEKNKSLNIYVSNDMMQDIQDLKNAQAGGDTTVPPKKKRQRIR